MVVAVALAVLSGCGPEPLPRTVYEFEQDRAALDAKLLECFADSRMLRTDLECKNARLAAGKIARDEQAERQRIHEKASQQNWTRYGVSVRLRTPSSASGWKISSRWPSARLSRGLR